VTRTAGPVAPCSVLGRDAVVACTAEAPWKVPWRFCEEQGPLHAV